MSVAAGASRANLCQMLVRRNICQPIADGCPPEVHLAEYKAWVRPACRPQGLQLDAAQAVDDIKRRELAAGRPPIGRRATE
jgi:hypothetical protein